MTAQEFLQSKQIYKLISDDGELDFSMFEIMEWMEEYGKQCFNAAREMIKQDEFPYRIPKHETFADYVAVKSELEQNH